jgi:hypothetical protein
MMILRADRVGRPPAVLRTLTTLDGVRTRRAALLLAAPLLALPLLAGCEAVNTASTTVDKAQLCARALAAAGYIPDVSNPQAAVDEAGRRAEELRRLAEQTSDAQIKRELREMADQLGSLKISDVNPVGVGRWADRKLAEFNQLQQVCGS